MTTHELSAGFITRYVKSAGENVEPTAILQVTSARKVDKGDGWARMRITCHDGVNSYGDVIVTSEDSLDDILVEFNVFRANHMTTQITSAQSATPSRLLIFCSDVTLLSSPGVLIGDPTPYQYKPSNDVTKPAPTMPKTAAARPPMSTVNGGGVRVTYPVTALTPYQNKTWNKPTGSGNLFSMTFADESSEIRATAFKAEADKYFDFIQEGKLYYISGGVIKQANKKWTSVRNDYELTFSQQTTVEVAADRDTKIPSRIYTFVTIDKLSSCTEGMVDLIAVVKTVGETQSITTKDGRSTVKRDVALVDDSNCQVFMTLWAEKAEQFAVPEVGPAVLALKGVSVREFNQGVSISASNAHLDWNPDIDRAHELAGWWESTGKETEMSSLSAAQGARASVVHPIFVAETLSNSMEDRQYYTIGGVVTRILTDTNNALYKSCGNSVDCKKKVVELGEGRYRCEKCNVESDKFKWSALLSVEVCDYSGGHIVSMFTEKVETMTGRTVAEIGALKDSDATDEYNAVWDALYYRQFTFRIMVKSETYNDESRIKWSVLSVSPLDEELANKTSLETIDKLMLLEE